ncbi:MAG: TonB-dependent receptor, partial [Bacteroidota bacterium]
KILKIGGKLQIGGKIQLRSSLYRINYQFRQLGFTLESDTPSFQLGTLSGISYVSYQKRLFPNLLMDAGLRTTYYLPPNRIYLDPRLRFRYRLGEYLNAHFAAGIYHQFAYQLEEPNDYQVGQRIWVQAALEGLPVLRAGQFTTGLQYHKDAWDLQFTFYARRTQNLVSWNPSLTFFDVQNLPRRTQLSTGSSRSEGVEFMLQRLGRKHQVWLGYSLSRTRFIFSTLNNGEAFDAPQDQRHRIKAAYMYHKKRWHLSTSFQLASGQPFNKPSIQINQRGNPVLTFTDSLNLKRLPSNHQVNLSATYDWHIRSIEHNWVGNMGISIFNLYNRRNVIGKTFIFEEENDQTGTTNEIRDLDRVSVGFTPTLFVSLNW